MNQNETAIGRTIQALEERLLQPETRASTTALRRLLAADFVEFGSSGRTFNRREIIRALTGDPAAWTYTLRDFTVNLLAPGLVLATYRIAAVSADGSQRRCSLRSSIWRYQDGRWQICFHQGTPAPC